MGDLDVGATAESLLRATAVAGGRVLANAPIVAGHVRPLQDALKWLEVFYSLNSVRQFI